jgi:hypothetical protein
MSRRLLLLAVPVLGAALIAPAAAYADPTTPAPGGTATTAPVTTSPPPSPATDTATVCKNVGTTLKGGWPPFQATLQQAKDDVSHRNLGAAQNTVKQAGQQLQALGTQIMQDGSQASDSTLKNTTASLGDELNTLGGKLGSGGLAGLKSFNPGKVAPLSKQLSSTCKGELAGVPLPG